MLESYAGGVNAFIQTASELPIEYRVIGSGPEPWEPWHSMAVFKVRHILMGSFERKLWNARMVRRLGYQKAQEAIPESRPGELLIVPPGAKYSGPTDISRCRTSLKARSGRGFLHGKRVEATTGRCTGAGLLRDRPFWPGTRIGGWRRPVSTTRTT